MAEPARSAPDVRPGGVVRPLSRVASRRCSRPGCPTPATATLTFRYDQQHASLVPLVDDGGPETYDLCGDHADRTHPPYGWTLEDDRPDDTPVAAPDPGDLASERTVAVLAAALRGEQPDADDGAPGDVDRDALDAIVAEPFDEPDLFADRDETDPVAPPAAARSTEALDELAALSAHAEVADRDDDHEDPHGIVEQVPARTVPGAHRPA